MKRRPASRANRSRARWLTAAAVTLAMVAATLPAAAAAAVTLGQLPATAPTPTCSSTTDLLQPSVTGGNFYIARQAGTITSWSTRSAGAGATYVFKVFRRTTDPDVFQVIARAPAHDLTTGLNTVPVNIKVRSGDMIGVNESGDPNSCTFPQPGDGLIRRGGNLAVGTFGSFTPQNDVRLNLSAVLVPSNDFQVASITRDRKRGTATVIVNVSNPGVVTIAGKALKKRPPKNVAVAGTKQFQLAATGAKKRKLERTGKVAVTPTITFFPSGGEPAAMTFTLKLKQRRRPPIRPVPVSRRGRS